ncbi:cytochrome c oxidase subunit 3 [Sphingomicrobium lutaoense]|uniref:Cytochrome c oxidase subunit 3 n=1 Tax=Sphingomicrobium lutaoense TaxID=515949 RepID=A0A839Z5M6_9SPHN|nr:cytochrome c oxidase subunit 3 [Sphingomicrobium lutaoense]MBB3764975.1 cytochrome c oxidase subunit 3 [Sphingomicrobium lutaoense]
MAGQVNHDYHILPPSIWPLIGSISAMLMLGGLVFWMHDNPYGQFISGAGLIGVLFTMWSWWSDVRREANSGDHTPVVQLHHRYGMILFIASEVMFFVAWFWAYFNASLFPMPIEVMGEVTELVTDPELAATVAQWPPKGIEVLDPFGYPLLNTLILLCSGTTVTWAHHALIHGDREGLKKGLWATIALGVLFTFIQGYEYGHAAFAFTGNIYGSTFMMATGFHGFHVIVGTIFLIVNLARAYKGDFTPKQHFGFEAAAWYWHFVDVVWLFLFAAIYVWGSWGAPIH